MAVQTWKDLKGIDFKFLKHSAPKYADIHYHLNSVYQGQVENSSFADIFTDTARTALQPDCAKMIRDAIWDIVTRRASPETSDKQHLTSLITGCKTKLVMQFDVGSRPKFIDYTCGNPIGKGLIEDLLNHTINNTNEEYATIVFRINTMHFITDFIPEDLSGMTLVARSSPPAQAATTSQANPAVTGTGPVPITPYNPMANFNVSSLPSDVLARYNLNKAANSVMTAADMGPFVDTSGPTPRTFLSHQANPQVFVTRSGSMFIFPSPTTGFDKATPDRFKKAAPKCNEWVPNCVRRW